jgi:hypothetical protein
VHHVQSLDFPMLTVSHPELPVASGRVLRPALRDVDNEETEELTKGAPAKQKGK